MKLTTYKPPAQPELLALIRFDCRCGQPVPLSSYNLAGLTEDSLAL